MTLLDILTPINIQGEKIKFFASSTYNPQFQYNWDKTDIESYMKSTSNNNKKELIETIVNEHYEQISHHAEKFFQSRIDITTLKIAEEILKSKPSFRFPRLQEEMDLAQKAFDFFGLDYTPVTTNESGFFSRPQCSKKQLLFSSDLPKQWFFSAESEIAHELSHIIRYENTKFNNIPISKDYLPTEEGLSTYIQDECFPVNNSSKFQHAAEYAVTPILLKGSLRDGFNFLCSIGFDKDLAWSRVIRHKFGFKDTSKPGDIMKPSMYFYHSQEIKTLSRSEMLRLFIGKISINDLKKYPEYTGKFPKEQIIKFFRLDSGRGF